MRYKYDTAGNRTNLTYPDGGSVSYGYDTANRLSGMTDWNGRKTTFGYDNVGRRIGLSLPNGAKASYSYDQAGRLTDLSHRTGGGSILDSFSYTYDQIGNRLSVTRPEEKLNYTYDLLDRLIQATPTKLQGKDKTMEHKAEDFTYDLVGNRLSGPEAKDTYTYNAGNQITLDRKNQYQYDRNGNLIRKTETDDDGSSNIWTHSYDAENRLVKVIKQEEDETKTITFKYDPFGRRIEKKVTETPSPLGGEGGGEGKTYTYVYDNEDIIAEFRTKSEGNKTKTEATKYLHGPGIDEPLATERKGETHSYHADGLGSITALTDARQKAVESYSYTSFGDLKRQGDKIKNSYTFTGREFDEEIDLYYYRARYYSPDEGRFISFDPTLRGVSHFQAASCSQSITTIPFLESKKLNPYLYAENNPANKIDPMGLASCKVVGTVWTHLTYYTNKGISGITKSGYPSGSDTVAVDPNVYKLKWKNPKKLAEQGCKWNEFDIPYAGHRIALDTGSAVTNRIDVWFQTDAEGQAFLNNINPKLMPNGEYANVTVYECSE